MNDFVFAVLTVSDSCSKGKAEDRSGPRLKECIHNAFANVRVITDIVPDQQDLILQKLQSYKEIKLKNQVNCVITTGGTGFAPSDVTPEATKVVLDKECPQLAMLIALESLKKTKFAALSRGLCGIGGRTLFLNFPGSEKAVVECFNAVKDLLPHSLQLLDDRVESVKLLHAEIQGLQIADSAPQRHICPHKTGTGDGVDRNSPFAMIPIAQALEIIFQTVVPIHNITKLLAEVKAPVDIPPFRASIKDGYAMKSTGFSGTKKVIGYIAAGDEINTQELQEDECFKINTGAPVPEHADCIIQVEDTKLLKMKKDGMEDLVEILIDPKANLDIRPIGCDLRKGSNIFPSADNSAVVIKSVLASVGQTLSLQKPKIAIISTGSELLSPQQAEAVGKIYDSNTTMLEELLNYFGFECMHKIVLSDQFDIVLERISDLYKSVDFVICSGGVSMGDKDYIKPAIEKLGFEIKFGRVNMKPGKPMTYAARGQQYFFGLPGNPVSAFVCFHLFALPAIRWAAGWERDKCELASLSVTLENDNIPLDPRPEYMRASITSINGRLYASVNGNQMSSRLQSIVGADVLLHCPGHTNNKPSLKAGEILRASVLRYDFISKYE